MALTHIEKCAVYCDRMTEYHAGWLMAKREGWKQLASEFKQLWWYEYQKLQQECGVIPKGPLQPVPAHLCN